MIKIQASAPSNIAFVKYMGKKNTALNQAENNSLSMILPGFKSIVELESRKDLSFHSYESDLPEGCFNFHSASLDLKGSTKFIKHLERCLERIPKILETYSISYPVIPSFYCIRSANNFPQAVGIASSASSFAALTLACLKLYGVDHQSFENLNFWNEIALLSREGSGSSCRSVFDLKYSFISWEEESVYPIESSLKLVDVVLMCGTEPKEVSSSLAHSRVKSSPNWEGRPSRANQRHQLLKKALFSNEIHSAYLILDQEWREMHELFHSSVPSFSYLNSKSKATLNKLSELNLSFGITLDAGPNIHLIFEASLKQEMTLALQNLFPELKSLSSKGFIHDC